MSEVCFEFITKSFINQLKLSKRLTTMDNLPYLNLGMSWVHLQSHVLHVNSQHWPSASCGRRLPLPLVHPQGAYGAVLSRSVMSHSLRPHGLSQASASVHGDSPGKDTGVGCHALLQGISPPQGSDLGFLHCRQTLSIWTTSEDSLLHYKCLFSRCHLVLFHIQYSPIRVSVDIKISSIVHRLDSGER